MSFLKIFKIKPYKVVLKNMIFEDGRNTHLHEDGRGNGKYFLLKGDVFQAGGLFKRDLIFDDIPLP